jgi:hypothetical protein
MISLIWIRGWMLVISLPCCPTPPPSDAFLAGQDAPAPLTVFGRAAGVKTAKVRWTARR